MRLLAVIGALAIVAALAAAVYTFGGFYSVAASSEDSAPVAWTLARVRQASIARHAEGSPPSGLEDPAQVQAGARAYAARGCVTCHGAPGVGWEKFSEGMRPYPPDLKDVVKDRTPAQLFWVIKNGIKMTAMPGFGLIEVPDPEIWSIVAFTRKLPTVSEADFKTWSGR
jgi:mono/diheme cytochrome c family protein